MALPSGSNAYDHAYEEAMIRIEGQMSDQEELAKQVLSWITCANRPLTTLELQHALAVEMDESELDEENLPEIEHMVSVCAGLVTVDEESHVIRLVHYTTQEYFERMQSRWFPNAETNITATCIAYLSFNVFTTRFCQTNKFTERLWLNPFLDYASRNWGHHARKISNLKQGLGQAIVDFLENEDLVNASVQGFFDTEDSFFNMNYVKETAGQMTSFDLVVYFELTAVVSLLFEQGTGPDSRIYCKTPLVLAAMNGREAIVKILLKQGVKIDSKDSKGNRTPLLYAAIWGHVAIVKLLLGSGAEIDSTDSEHGRTPLSYAAEYGHTAVIKLLLENGAEIDSKDSEHGRTPLSYAAENGHTAVIKLLLENGAEIDSKDSKYGRTPLSYAAEDWEEVVVKILLENGADLALQDNNGRTPLSYAAKYGQVTVVRLLLGNSAEIDSKDSEHDRTPLSYAAEHGRAAVIKLLLDNNAEIDSKDSKYGRTPLSWAAGNKNMEDYRILLQWTPIRRRELRPITQVEDTEEAEDTMEAVVRLLLQKGADLDSKDLYSRTPLSYAAANGCEAVVELLLGSGAEVESMDKYGETPLSLANENGHEAVVKLLLKKGAEGLYTPVLQTPYLSGRSL